MSYSVITQPNAYMAGYSAVPLKVFSTDYNQQYLFKYLINVTYDKVTISSDSSVNIGNSVYTLLTSTTAHEFEIGDTVLLDDNVNSGNQTGYYIVQANINSTQFAIDLIPNTPFPNSGFTVSKVIKYKLSPDLDGYGKIDLSNTLKDFVSQNLTGQTQNYALSYDGPDTKFCYDIYCGSEQQYALSFDDNLFSGGSVGFYASGITSLSGVPFQVGDVIRVEQDVVEWAYTDNFFNTGAVGFTGSTSHSFLPGQQITVTGQQTYPYYNGQTTISGVTANSLTTFKIFQGATPTEGGYIYGVPRPEYNATCTITQIFIDPTYGLVIITDNAYTTASVQIPGTIVYADGRITETPVELTITGKCVFNAHIDIPDYSLTAYDPYVIQSRSASSNNISTIFNTTNCYRIEDNTIGFLLQHVYNSTYVDAALYTFFSNGTQLGQVAIDKPASSTDFYSPIGLGQIGQSNYSNVAGVFSGYSGNVTSYNVVGADEVALNVFTPRTNDICFQINEDCSMYEVYHLMWKDKLGSFVSYPFIYMSRENIEVERQTYYKQEGTWQNNTFGYDDYGNGEKNFYLKSRRSYILNSGWLKEFERNLILDLMQSPSVYIQTPDNRLFQCHLNETSVEIYKNINEQLFSYTFNVRVSNNEYRF